MARDIINEKQDLTYLRWSHVRGSSGTAGTFLKSESTIDGVKKYYKLSNFDMEKGVIGHECINEIIVDRFRDDLLLSCIEDASGDFQHDRILYRNMFGILFDESDKIGIQILIIRNGIMIYDIIRMHGFDDRVAVHPFNEKLSHLG